MNGFTILRKSYIFYMIALAMVLTPLLSRDAFAAGISPTVTISQVKTINNMTTISGTVTDDATPNDQVKISMYDSANNLIGTAVPQVDGNWVFSKKLPNGVYSFYVKAEDADLVPNVTTSDPFEVDAKRPYITSINVDILNLVDSTAVAKNIDILKSDDMTRVSPTTQFKFKLTDNTGINDQTLSNPITLFSKKGTVNGIISYTPDTQELVFTPAIQLEFRTTYYLMFNPEVISPNSNPGDIIFSDNTGNTAFPLIKKFTTVSEIVKNANIGPTTADWDQNPHGYYTDNVNTCANCHNTHVSQKPLLEQPTNKYAPKYVPLESSYCMACHDGTTTAPLPENMEPGVASKHEFQMSGSQSTSAQSCTACHNPHLNWTEENPNLLKDHYVYQHQGEDLVGNTPVGEIDSSVQLCEACHDRQTNYPKNAVKDTAYRILHYRKETAAIGNITTSTQIVNGVSTQVSHVEDYDLCLTCHNTQNAIKNNTIIDILTYYTDSQSKHFITAQDNSSLNGQLPCSECHETHGSQNIKLIKTRLGHENQPSDFTASSGEWDASKERTFCTKCHNGSTAIYGVTGRDLDSNLSPGHATDSTQACSACHGTGVTEIEKARSAAHAPHLPVPDPPAQP